MRSVYILNRPQLLFIIHLPKLSSFLFIKELGYLQLVKCIINGFKSFAEHTEIAFDNGASIIVGPNGSGKSNILDAIQWVLGEQNPRNLRGTKMEDVIFAGTINRAAIGMAEVSLIINNASKALALDEEEIVVTRRLFRSGKSEYRLNGKTCRYKDITNLFMNTGLGKNSYAFIGQGEVDKILQAKPKELRLLFEEVAGIARYKTQKQYTEAQLDSIKRSIQRIQDLISELQRDLQILRQRAENAQQYQRLQETLKSLSTSLCQADYQTILNKLKINNKRAQALVKQQEDEAVLQDTYTAKHHVIESQKQQLYDEKNEREKDIVRLEMTIQTCQEQIQTFKQQVRTLNETIQQDQSDIDVTQTQINHLSTQYEQNITANDELKEQHQRLKQKMQTIQGELNLIERYLREHNVPHLEQQRGQLEAQIGALKQEITRFTQEVSQKNDLFKQIAQLHNELQTKLQQHLTEENALTEQITSCQKTQSMINEKLRHLNANIDAFAQKNKYYEQQLQSMNKRYNHLQSRIAMTKRMASEYTGYHQGVRSIMKAHHNGEKQCQGIIGIISELITIPDYLYTAMSAALGGALQYVITEKAEDATQAIQYLLKHHAGRATFLPLDRIRPRLGFLSAQILEDEAVIGRGCDCVKYQKHLEPAIQHVLGNTLLVQNRTAALRLTKQYQLNLTVVTLDGDVFRSTGSISGGKTKQNYNEELLQRQKQLLTLEKEFNALIAEQETTYNAKRQLDETLQLAKQEEAQQRIQLQELTRSLQEHEKHHFVMTTQTTQLQTRLEESQSQLQTVTNERQTTEQQLQACQTSLQTCEAAKLAIQGQLEKVSASTEQLYTLRRDFFAAEAELKYVVERENFFLQAISTSKEALDKERQRVHHLEQTLNKHHADLKDLTTKLINQRDTWELNTQSLAVLNTQVRDIRQNIADKNHEDETCRKALERLDQSQRRHEQQVTKLMITETKLTTELKHLEGKLYKLNHGQNVTAMPPIEINEQQYAQMKQDMQTVNQQLQNLGEVDLSSISSYEERCQRIEFLENQKEDLLASAEKLLTIIADTDQLCHTYLSQTIEEINTHFMQIFQALFQGGIAEVIWEKADDLFDSGIIIKAQPPGKKLQHIALLSGGEKALTAIALLLAFFKIKPSTFCIMDEIDAPLDESNNIRLAEYLATVANDTQIIVISHSPHTMQVAQQLYGVVMEEQGVSRVISVSLEER